MGSPRKCWPYKASQHWEIIFREQKKIREKCEAIETMFMGREDNVTLRALKILGKIALSAADIQGALLEAKYKYPAGDNTEEDECED